MANEYRAEVIGSLLRPEYLKHTRQRWEAKEISTREFKEAEDRAVDEMIALQQDCGVDVITRRDAPHSFHRAADRRHLGCEADSGYSSWLNQVENWFARIERDVIARGVFTSVRDLARKLMRYIRHYNRAPKPIKWTYRDPSHRINANTISSVTGH
jgi:hypothetical protein